MEKHASPVPTEVLERQFSAQIRFQVIRGAALLLLFIGLIMVLSSSYYQSKLIYDNVFTIFARQSLFAMLGAIALVTVARMDQLVLRRLSPIVLLGVIGLLILVFIPGLGSTVGGQTNWLDFGFGIRLQPSEFAKFALVVFGAHQLAIRQKLAHHPPTYFAPLAIGTLAVLALIVFAGDVGNAVIIVITVASMIFVANAPLRYFFGVGIATIGAIGILAWLRPYRWDRITIWLNPERDPEGLGFQALHAKYAMASGGILGQGLGAGREKWGTLPEAHTDFIFAVIGEELGLLGGLAVLIVFFALCLAIVSLGRSSQSDFVRYVCAGSVGWIGGQTMVNVGAVLGLLPIMGVPLPLVSAGGSALIPTLAIIGLLLAMAQNELKKDTSLER